jgi:LEA14-like dessication related protein
MRHALYIARMDKRTFRAIILLALFASGGCQAIQSLGQSLQRPTARVTGARLTDVTLESAAINFDVDIANPYPVALPLVNMKYALAGGGSNQPFVSGAADVQGSIPANSSKTITVPAKVVFAQLFQVLAGVKPGSVVPYDASLTLSVNAPQVGALDLPLQHSGQLPVPTVPAVALSDIQWQNLTLEKADGLLHLHVTNRNQFAFDTTKLSLQLSLGGSNVIGAEQPQSAHFDPNAEQTIEVPISFSPKALGLAALGLLRGQSSSYTLNGLLDLNTAFGPMQLPYSSSGQAQLR